MDTIPGLSFDYENEKHSNNDIDKKTFNLTLPDVRTNNPIYVQINKFNKPELVKAFQPLAKVLLARKVTYDPKSSAEVLGKYRKIKSLTDVNLLKKAEITTMYSSFMSHRGNNEEIFRKLPGYKELGLKFIESDRLSYNDVSVILGRKPVIVTTSGWDLMLLPDILLNWCGVSMGANSFYYFNTNFADSEFYITASTRKHLIKMLLPESATKPKLSDTLPDDEQLEVDNRESQIVGNFMYLSGLASSGRLFTSSGNLTRTKIDSILKKMNGGKLAATPDDENMTDGQAIVLAFAKFVEYSEMFSSMSGSGKMDVKNFLRFIPGKLGLYLSGTDFGIMLQKFTGFTKSWAESSNAQRISEGVMELLYPATDKWMSMDNFLMRYKCEDLNVQIGDNYLCLFNRNERRKSQLKASDDKSYYRTNRRVDWWSDITLPFIVNLIKLFCANGLLEIAYAKKAPADDVLEGIRYVRFTKAGLFAIGRSVDYDVKMSDDIAKSIDFDDDNSIITLLNPDSPLHDYLAVIGEKISGTRYRVTAKSLVAGSESSEGVVKNVSYFKSVICKEPKGVWKSILDEALDRSASSIPIHEGYTILKLDPKVPGLIDFAASNSKIAENSIKCEESMLLIRSENFDKIVQIFLKEGYIV